MSKAQILDKSNKVRNIQTSKFFKSRIRETAGSVRINSVLPFRIKITNIGIVGYSPNNPAPIGIAVIGLNNYIL
jgi:hypothetical protein